MEYTIYREYVDEGISGVSTSRPALDKLFDDATKRRFDIALVWALDRLTRDGIHQALDYIKKLTDHRVQFESYTEPHFRTNGPFGELAIAMAAWGAKQERLRIQERTTAGRKKALAGGKRFGPPLKVFDREQATRLRAEGKSWAEVSRLTGVAVSTLRENVPKV